MTSAVLSLVRRTAAPALLAVPAALAAQDTPGKTDTAGVTELAPIEVMATRSEAVAPPVATIQVGAAQLHRTPASDPYDLVRRGSGIEVHQQGQGPGFASDAVIRGFTSDHSSDVLLVVDGVPINLPVHGHVEGYADWSILSPAAVSTIRVIHGPASPLYGDFAFGGVVEATTAPDADETTAAIRGSSFGDAGGWVRTGRRDGRGGFLAALEGTREQGWRDNSGYWLGNGVLRGWRKLGAARIEGGLLLYGSSWDSPGFVPVSRYNAGDLETATDPTDGGNAQRLIVQGRYERPLGPATSLDAMVWGQGVRSRVFLNIPEDDAVSQTGEEDRRVAVGGQARVVRQVGAGELALGVSGRSDWTTYDLYHTVRRTREAGEEQADDAAYQNGATFVRWRGLIGTRIVYDLGGRIDLLHYSALDRLEPAAGRRGKTRALASPKLGARYLLGSRVALLASFSRGFRGPVGVIGEPSRPPVVAWSKELGISYSTDRLQGHMAFFRLDVSNERILDPVTREVSDAGESVRQGVSLDLTWVTRRNVRLMLGGTFNDARITDVAEASAVVVPRLAVAAVPAGIVPSLHDVILSPGDRVPGVARWFGRAGVETDLTQEITTRALFRFSGPVTPIGEPGVRTQDYGLLDLGASLRLSGSGTALDLDLLNVLDTKYPELRASGFINPGAPRSLRAAIRFGGA